MGSQWQRLLKNTGTWEGSFTQLAPDGRETGDVPTQVILEPQGDAMRQVVRRLPPGQPPEDLVLTYRTLARGVRFCPTGAFSQGSLQWSPVAEFGAELGLIYGPERLRLVQRFQPHAAQSHLHQLTLIRERLAGTAPPPRPALTLDQLLGTWEGTATTLYADLQPESTAPTRLELTSPDGTTLHQRLQVGDGPPLRSQGSLGGSAVRFTQGRFPVTVLLLPGGASATFPPTIAGGQPVFLEAGWLITPTLRQRLIRTYSPQGEWVSLTLVEECRG